MDTLAALGLAGNVVQFILFLSELVSAGSDVYHSMSGASERTLELERIYEALSTFSASLQSPRTAQVSRLSGLRPTATFTQTAEDSHHKVALDNLATDCKELCDQLLKTLQKLKVEGKRWRRFNSFMAALKAAWSSRKIVDLEERLDRYQRAISLHFFPILRDQQADLMRTVTLLREESYRLKLDQNSKLDAIWTTLGRLVSTIDKPTDELSKNQSGFMGPSRAELSSPEYGGNFQRLKPQSSLLTLDRVRTLTTGLSKLALTEQELEDISREQAILRSLNFPSRPARHDNIPVAHKKTFRWMISPPEEMGNESEHKFPNWLRGGDGIFWVSGKAGSGKSTLMKFVADHDSTRTLLEEWANGARLVIAAHYFWSAGTRMQKSHEGLFRTILYEVFRTSPALIPQVCPVRWKQTSSVNTENDTEWTIPELLGTLHALPTHADLPVRYCFFIDGIDEFDGDHSNLCEIVQDLSQSPNIKLCLASRPWNVFIDAFSNNSMQRICLEELTRNDILRYTEYRLMEHPRWKLCHFQERDKQSIIDDITGRASGVFLWVFLVTKSLRDGLTNFDNMLDLRRRLDSLPTDLERFFKHMLDAVDPIYYTKMAGFLSMATNARRPLCFLVYSMHEHEYEDKDYVVKLSRSTLSEDEIEILREQCQRRINAICGGLLEIKHTLVEFLHRTVRDFLLTREMSDYLAKKAGSEFSANLSTFRAYVAIVNRCPQFGTTVSLNWMGHNFLGESLQYARDALEESEDPTMELMEYLEGLYLDPWVCPGGLFGLKPVSETGTGLFGGNTNFCQNSPGFLFRKDLLRAGVDKYVLRKLCQNQHYFDDLNEPPLSVVIREPKWTTGHVQIIRYLLESGQDPNIGNNNERCSSSSPWGFFIRRTCRKNCNDDFDSAIESGLFSLFLRRSPSRGANIDGPLKLGALDKDTTLFDNMTNVPVCARRGEACSDFVRVLFSRYPKHPSESLRVLGDFLDLPLCEWLDDEILSTLQMELGKIDPKATRLEKLKFSAKVTEKVVDAARSRGRDMGFLLPNIEKAFPGTLGSTILELLNPTTALGSQESEVVSRKRRCENDLLDRAIKRIK